MLVLFVAGAIFVAPLRLAAQEPVAEADAADTEAEDAAPADAAPPDDDGANLWWLPGVLGLVATAVSIAGFTNAVQSQDQLMEQRQAAEACSAAGRVGPECEGLGRFARALLAADSSESVCVPETAAELGIEDICDRHDRDRRRKAVYLTVGTLGFLVAVGSFIAYAVLENRDDDEPEDGMTRLRPWVSLGEDRGAGLALDLTF